MLMTVTVALALIVGGLALVEVSTGFLREAFASSDGRQARAAAEAGIDQIINTWNQPENRKMLVSGTAMTSWAGTTSGETLRSPCVRNNGTRPGNNDGQPTAEARSFGDGQFRDVGTGATNTGERRFRLTSLTYATGASGASDRRSLRRTTELGTGSIAAVGTPPSGASWDSLINLDDPDGEGSGMAGDNRGYITLAVTGQVVRSGRVVATSTVTREFEILPKCCGASLGSNGSGGTNVSGRSLGSDSRFCGLQWGIITGINGGTHWSYYANDRFTTRNADGTIVGLSTMLGALKPGETQFQRSNCRVIPTLNNSACSPSQSSQDRSYANSFSGATPRANCIQPTGSSAFFPGTQNDILGKSISCVPIIPITLSSLPRISDSSPGSGDGRYNFNWASGSGPATRIAANNYPSISSSSSTFKYVVRTNKTTSPPRVEVCTGSGSTPCNNISWQNVSQDIPNLNVGDNLLTGQYNNFTGTNLWTSNWLENDFPDGSNDPNSGNVQIVSAGSSRQVLLGDATNTGSILSRRSSIARRVDLSGVGGTPVTLSFNFTKTNLRSGDDIVLETRRDSSNPWSEVGKYGGNSSNGVKSATLPAGNISGSTEIRFRVEDDLTDNGFALIGNIQITAPGFDAWCAYSASSPVTAAPGFHCLGPTVNLSYGAQWLIDTTGGPLTFYYTQPTDNRGLTGSSPLISMSNGSSLAHVLCSSLQNNCTTPVEDSVFSPVGEPDRLNFFGRDRGSSAITQYILVNSQFNSPVKISGVWFYFPEGDLTLNVNDCSPSQPSNFYTNNDNWTLSGRVWVKNFKPCGAFHFRVPPSNLANATSLFGAIDTPGDASFVAWSGVDWVARATTNVRFF